MTPLLVVLGAIVGAPLRYLVDRAVQARHDSAYPWGTLAVNVAGSFVLGLVVTGVATQGWSPHISALVGTGFCGALTTYSTFSYETVRLFEQRAHFYAIANIVLSVGAGLGAAFCGYAFAMAF